MLTLIALMSEAVAIKFKYNRNSKEKFWLAEHLLCVLNHIDGQISMSIISVLWDISVRYVSHETSN